MTQTRNTKSKGYAVAKASARMSTGGPAKPGKARGDALAKHAAEVQTLASAVTANPLKKAEFGRANALKPTAGTPLPVPSKSTGASTLSEVNTTAKTGDAPSGDPAALAGALNPKRGDAAGHVLTTNQGTPISDNQNSLKAGLRGPVLLEDFVLREKITHFDHERIPERIVHARGSAAHGYFEAYKAIPSLTRAAPFTEAGKVTPVFVRFSTVAGERGSVDTARDVRGFAVKFYTDEGNWDLVGNNIPVFFIQDAMKFPDLIHAVKPEPNNAMPQAASAHDTFYDFISLMPESTHMMLWAMSDRALPRSYRMMQGFGVHTYRFVNEDGKSHLVKFHWNPKQGTHSLVWDEAAKIQGADADFHRRDLWDAIEAGDYPEWELGVQVFTDAEADKFSFDVLDATKLVPEELVPVQPIGRMVLNRNPDNFFAETEQVAFCVAHVVPGIDFTNDPLLAGRIHSYIDTQISRLGGANFHELPINAPLAPPQNNQRDGVHRQTINRGRVSYEPNTLGGGCPFQAGAAGFVSFPQPVDEYKLRGKPEKFADHYTQATLFWNSQADWEKDHIVGGFRFELSKLTVPAIRQRMLASLRNVAEELATRVADGLGMELPAAMPRVLARPAKPEVTQSPALSLSARPGAVGIRTRKVAILVAPGAELAPLQVIHAALLDAGALPVYVAPKLGSIKSGNVTIEPMATLENSPSVLFDAMVIPSGTAGVDALKKTPQTREFVEAQFSHCKAILAVGEGKTLLPEGAVSAKGLAVKDGVLLATTAEAKSASSAFMDAIAKHRFPDRLKA